MNLFQSKPIPHQVPIKDEAEIYIVGGLGTDAALSNVLPSLTRSGRTILDIAFIEVYPKSIVPLMTFTWCLKLIGMPLPPTHTVIKSLLTFSFSLLGQFSRQLQMERVRYAFLSTYNFTNERQFFSPLAAFQKWLSIAWNTCQIPIVRKRQCGRQKPMAFHEYVLKCRITELDGLFDNEAAIYDFLEKPHPAGYYLFPKCILRGQVVCSSLFPAGYAIIMEYREGEPLCDIWHILNTAERSYAIHALRTISIRLGDPGMHNVSYARESRADTLLDFEVATPLMLKSFISTTYVRDEKDI
ncbi:hypothetical protein N7517_000351 [Penicillium concentricum]|uniref:Uncharacterized protein n=1 Tax=Penicillium concentricum TaxID=293559 RepID=A0A9W9SQU1_9EURO|nr:uncharacterized protein N7517_000351 [Penicillium concentricum]KAJ5382440.1 hypothetical protein N7517_000351 [Penicillium concentricum]